MARLPFNQDKQEKEEIKVTEPEKVTPLLYKEPQQPQPQVIVSEIDSYIHDRMKSQPKSMEEVDIKVESTFENTKHMLALPKELEKYGDRYSFRWLNKKKRSIDNALDVIGWSLVNRSIFRDLPNHLFTANGSVERGDAILACIPRKRAEEIRLKPAQISRERVRNTPVQDLRKWEQRSEYHYKPDLGAAENDKEESRGIIVQPDSFQETGVAEEK